MSTLMYNQENLLKRTIQLKEEYSKGTEHLPKSTQILIIVL